MLCGRFCPAKLARVVEFPGWKGSIGVIFALVKGWSQGYPVLKGTSSSPVISGKASKAKICFNLVLHMLTKPVMWTQWLLPHTAVQRIILHYHNIWLGHTLKKVAVVYILTYDNTYIVTEVFFLFFSTRNEIQWKFTIYAIYAWPVLPPFTKCHGNQVGRFCAALPRGSLSQWWCRKANNDWRVNLWEVSKANKEKNLV